MIIFPFAAIVAGVGLIESLLTLNIVDEITETRGPGKNKEAVAQGAANILSGVFSDGGCVLIGQSLINVYDISTIIWNRSLSNAVSVCDVRFKFN